MSPFAIVEELQEAKYWDDELAESVARYALRDTVGRGDLASVSPELVPFETLRRGEVEALAREHVEVEPGHVLLGLLGNLALPADRLTEGTRKIRRRVGAQLDRAAATRDERRRQPITDRRTHTHAELQDLLDQVGARRRAIDAPQVDGATNLPLETVPHSDSWFRLVQSQQFRLTAAVRRFADHRAAFVYTAAHCGLVPVCLNGNVPSPAAFGVAAEASISGNVDTWLRASASAATTIREAFTDA